MVHMSEETRRAKHAVPRAMVWSILTNGILAWTIGIVLLTTQTDNGLSDDGFPIISMLYVASGSSIAVNTLCLLLVILSFAVLTASLASVSRITFAWARDGAMPNYFAHVSSSSLSPCL